MALPLEVFADLQLAVDGDPIDVRANGDRIVMDVPTLRAGRRLLAAEPFDEGAHATRQVHKAFREAGLTLEVHLDGRPVATVGEGADPGRLSRLLRLDGVEVRPGPTVRQVVRQRPLLAAAVVAGLAGLIGGLIAFWRRDT